MKWRAGRTRPPAKPHQAPLHDPSSCHPCGDVCWRGLRDLSRAEVVLQPMAERQCARCLRAEQKS
eukprot:363517-Chlamydomonas_euryale.AAC.4